VLLEEKRIGGNVWPCAEPFAADGNNCLDGLFEPSECCTGALEDAPFTGAGDTPVVRFISLFMGV
jgi:hypothetical protein